MRNAPAHLACQAGKMRWTLPVALFVLLLFVLATTQAWPLAFFKLHLSSFNIRPDWDHYGTGSGKFVGITGACWLLTKVIKSGVYWICINLHHVIGVSLYRIVLASQMSTFIATLGFDTQPLHLYMQNFNFVSSVISAIFAYYISVLLKIKLNKKKPLKGVDTRGVSFPTLIILRKIVPMSPHLIYNFLLRPAY